ncbi:MAG: FecR domain-containing protein [bacterium]|nr:FecR domain-containing protein [bacterium]
MITKIFCIFTFLALFTSQAWGLESVAKINKVSGSVQRYENGISIKAEILKKGDLLFEGDRIATGKESLAFLEYNDGSKILLKAETELLMEKEKLVSVAKGRALFHMLKQAISRFRVKMKTVTIGVRGTTFLTEVAKDSSALYLKEGRLNVYSEEGEFKRFKKRELDEFEKYKEKENEAFEEYKRKLEEEFIEYVKEFEMEGGTAINIEDNEVRDIITPPDVESDFELLDNPDLI